jgi:hypothetical protein
MLQLSKEENIISQQLMRYIDENYAPEQKPQDDDVEMFVDYFIDRGKPSEIRTRKNQFCENILAFFDGETEQLKACCKKAYPCTHALDKILEGTFSPTKEAVCKLIIAAEFDIETATRLLQSEKIPPCQYNKLDVIMMFFVKNQIYDFSTINKMLLLLDMPLWGWSFV